MTQDNEKTLIQRFTDNLSWFSYGRQEGQDVSSQITDRQEGQRPMMQMFKDRGLTLEVQYFDTGKKS